MDKRRETKVRDALTEQLEKLREEIDAQLQDSSMLLLLFYYLPYHLLLPLFVFIFLIFYLFFIAMFTAENLATAHANFINSRYQFFLYQAASIPQSQPTNSVSTSTYIMVFPLSSTLSYPLKGLLPLYLLVSFPLSYFIIPSP